MTMIMSSPFSTVLRERTAAAHAAAEGAPFLVALARGRVTPAGVIGLLQRLLPVYEALEDVGRRCWSDDLGVRRLLVPGLARVPALRRDLLLLGASAEAGSPAAASYVARIRTVGESSAPAFVAHHYTRYLGDLSGGQIIARALRTRLDLELSFLTFPDLRGPTVKQEYRAGLDALNWGHGEQDEAVAEADLAFGFNRALAAELEGEVVP